MSDSDGSQEKSVSEAGAKALLEARRKLDETVYRNERLAQQYERALVHLWDRLRTSDPFAVLESRVFAV